MPRRRAGKAVGAGIGAGLSSLGEAFTALANKRYESDLAEKRQIAVNKEQQLNQLREIALRDPAVARRLIQSGRGEELGLSGLGPSSEDLQGPLLEQIRGAKSQTDLPTNEEMAASDTAQGGQFSMTGGKEFTGGQVPVGIDAILARTRARDAAQKKFLQVEGAKPITVPGVGPGGELTETRTTEAEAAGKTYPKERTNQGEAARQGTTQFATTAASERAQTTPEAVRGAATRAGAIKAAQEAVTVPTGSREGGARAVFDTFKDLSTRINVLDGPEQIATGLKRRVKATANLDNEADLFMRQRQGLGVLLAVMAQGSRPTDRDAKVFEDMLPSLTTNKGVAEPLLINFERMISTNPIPMSLDQILALPEGTPIPGVRAIGRAAVAQQLRSAQPTTPQPSALDRLRAGEQ